MKRQVTRTDRLLKSDSRLIYNNVIPESFTYSQVSCFKGTETPVDSIMAQKNSFYCNINYLEIRINKTFVIYIELCISLINIKAECFLVEL